MSSDDDNRQLVNEAESWLTQALQDLEPYYIRDSIGPSDRLKQELAEYTPELREAVDSVLSSWLASGDEDQVKLALSLVVGMERKHCVPAVERLLHEINSGQCRLPKHVRISVQNTLRVMRLRDADQG